VVERGALAGDQRLARLWIALETFPELRASRELWDVVLGGESPFWPQFLQEEAFAEDKEYALFVTSSEKKFVLHTSKTGDFLDFDVFEKFLRLDLRKFGKAVAQAFEVPPKFANLGIPKTSQIAEMATLPIVLTIQHNYDGLRRVAAELVSMIGRAFVLLAPTRKYVDANIEAILSRCHAVFFDLESNLKISQAGQLLPRKSAKKLLSPLLLDQEEHANKAPTSKRNGLSNEKTTPNGSLLLGMGAAAGLLGVSRTTLWRLIRDGQLKKVEVLPGSFRVRREDLEAIAAGNGQDTDHFPFRRTERRRGA
jgi:excisionase family DNA binding protein